jgi:hypothetical protein
MRRAIFVSTEFVSGASGSADEKSDFANQLLWFMDDGCQRKQFTLELYISA